MKTLIKNAQIVNEGKIFKGDVLIENDLIAEISENIPAENIENIINAEGEFLIPGVIDDQVHFREPGLTHKGDIESESRAAVAGGVTSFIEQPNTVPNAVTQELLEEKYKIASKNSSANYSFSMGGTNDNLEEVLKTNPKNVAAVLGVNPYFMKEYDVALKNYPMKKVSQIVASLRDIDVKSKGVGANALSQSDLLREMLYKIFN